LGRGVPPLELRIWRPTVKRELRPSAGGNTYDVTVTGSGSGSVTDLNFGTLRARAGWALGNFLPYGFAGVAVGHANVNIAATVFGQENPPAVGACLSTNVPPCTPFSFTGTAGKNGEWMVGFTFGGGLDVALTRNVFLRAEYEYVQFAPIANLIVDVSTGRGGLGIKF
jgi:outer membrane immunogenic protein